MDSGKPAHQAAPTQSTVPTPTPTPSRPDDVTEAIESAHQRQLLEVSEWALTIRDEVDDLREELARLESSQSWRLTEPLRRAAQTWQSRSAILTWPPVMRVRRALRKLPLPTHPIAAFKRVVLHRLFGIAPRRVAQGSIAFAGGRQSVDSPPISRALPLLAPERLPDIFVWAIIDWHFPVQRPQHIARGLSGAGHRVFYVSPRFVDRAGPGFDVEPIDETGSLFVIRLHAESAPPIRTGSARGSVHAQILAGLGRVLDWTAAHRTVNLVQHPFWQPFAEVVPNNVLVYDCIDQQGGVGDNSPDIVALESRLLRRADLVVVASSWLERIVRQANPRVALVGNASDYEHFSRARAEIDGDPNGRRIIGYCGPIAEWLDIDLVRAVARSLPDTLVLLVGPDTVGAGRQLRDVDNVTLTGEVSYDALPGYMHAFDVCICPLRVLPSTLAADPPAIYDYLSSGKPVVAVDLPHIRHFGELVLRAGSAESFVSAVRESLAEPAGSLRGEARKRFASEHTWTQRVEILRRQIDGIRSPLVSVIVVTHNNIELTRQCLASLDAMTAYPRYEITVVDNASSDGTQALLEQWADGCADRHVILSPDNRGFAAASNQGLAAAAGDYFVLLNNDTVVTAGWLGTLIGHLRRDPRIGLISAVTDNTDSEARIDVGHADPARMHEEARLWTTGHMGQTRAVRSAAFFCVAMSREIYREVGPLDEAFGIGMFEDDDYCRRVEQTGRRIVCALDVFVHHESAASFDAMDQGRRWELFERNKQIYEAKWGRWQSRRIQSQSPEARAPMRFRQGS